MPHGAFIGCVERLSGAGSGEELGFGRRVRLAVEPSMFDRGPAEFASGPAPVEVTLSGDLPPIFEFLDLTLQLGDLDMRAGFIGGDLPFGRVLAGISRLVHAYSRGERGFQVLQLLSGRSEEHT